MPELPEPDVGAAAAAAAAPAQAQPAAPAPKVKTKSDDARAPAVKRAVTCEPGEGAASSAPAAKKRKKPKKPKTQIPIVGIVFAMLCWKGEDCFYSYARMLSRGLLAIEDMYVVVAEGDRHGWGKSGLKTRWQNEFYDEAPHTVYRVPKDGKLWVPKHVILGDLSREVKGDLVAITAVEQARAILEHMLNKKWVPKCAVSEEDWEELNGINLFALDDKKHRAAKAKAVALAAKDVRLEALYLMLSHFTENIDTRNLSSQEICRGGIEKGETPLDTVFRESNEEMDIKIWDSGEHITQCGHITFQNRKGDLKRTALFASFTSHPFHGPENGDCWPDNNADRDAEYGNWFCAHSWYKYDPFLDTDAMDKVKAFRETRNIREVPLEEAMQILGEPSQNALRAIDAHFRKVFRSVEDPEEAEPAAAAKKPAAAKEPVIEQDLPPPGSEALKPYKITNNVPALKRYLEEAKAGGDAGAIKAYTEMLEIAIDQKNSWIQRSLAEAARNPNRLGATIFE